MDLIWTFESNVILKHVLYVFFLFFIFLYLFKDKFELIRLEFLHIQEDFYLTCFIYHMFMKWLLLKSLQLRVLLIYRLMSLFTPVAATQYNMCVCVCFRGWCGAGDWCLLFNAGEQRSWDLHSQPGSRICGQDGWQTQVLQNKSTNVTSFCPSTGRYTNSLSCYYIGTHLVLRTGLNKGN